MDATITVLTLDNKCEPMDTTSPKRVSGMDAETSRPSQVVLPVQNTVTAVLCSIILQDVSVKLKGKTSVVFPPSEEEMCKAKVCLQWVDQISGDLPWLRGRKRQRSQGNWPTHKAKDDVKYVFMDVKSGEDTKPDEKARTSNKSAPSGYRLAAHQYMVAKKQGLIEGPRTRTQALKFPKTRQATSTDSEATIDYMSDSAPPPRKCRGSAKNSFTGKTSY